MTPCTRSAIAILLLACGARVDAVEFHTFMGMAWRDMDFNGIRDSGEASLGAAGVTIELWDAQLGTRLQTVQTNADGRYVITHAAAGPAAYRLRVDRHLALYPRISPMRVGSDPSIDSDFHATGPLQGYSDPVVGISNVPITSIDVGLDPNNIVVGDKVWLDLDGDGLQDAGEPGLGGVDVELWNGDLTVLWDVATSRATGTYVVIAPGYGSYRLHFSLPAGASRSPWRVGSNSAVDSDVIDEGTMAGWTAVQVLQQNLLSTMGIDAGYVFQNPVDVALEFSNVPSLAYPGGVVSWTLWAREQLQRPIGSVRLQASVPPGMSEFSWQCTAQGGASCPSSGTGTLDLVQTLPANAALRFDFTARAGNSPAAFESTASAQVASPQTEVTPYNNTAQAIIHNDSLFRGNFDPGG